MGILTYSENKFEMEGIMFTMKLIIINYSKKLFGKKTTTYNHCFPRRSIIGIQNILRK